MSSDLVPAPFMEALEEEDFPDVDQLSSSDTEFSEVEAELPRGNGADDAKDSSQLKLGTDPLCGREGQGKVPTTADIRHFFDRTRDGAVCRLCK